MARHLQTLAALLLTIVNLSSGILDASPLETVDQWKLISFNFPPNARIHDRDFYTPENIVVTCLAVGIDRIFLGTPQLFSGVPATVSSIPKNGFTSNPALEVFPDWSFAVGGRKDFNCSELKLISVYRLKIDSCNRLWAMDAGVVRSLEDYELICPPKILVIDLNKNQVVRRIDFPREVLRGESLLTNIIVDETTSKRGTCDDVFVYMSDTVEPAIVVYDSERDVTWRLSHPSMYPDPDFAQSEILGDRFVLMDGVVGLTFDDKSGILYYQPLATDRVFSVSREVLRAGPLGYNQLLHVKLVGKKSSQGIGLAVSPIDSSLIFSPLSETAVASWNPINGKQRILAADEERLQFVADITASRFDPGVIYMVSSKFQRFFLRNLNRKEFNNRILRIDLNGSSRGLQSFGTSIRPPGINYYHGNTLDKRPSFGTTSGGSFFTSGGSSFGKPQPFRYEPVGVIQKSIRNPFIALNQGEALPTKFTRKPPEKSFLDDLDDTSYTYRRFIRSPSEKKNAVLY